MNKKVFITGILLTTLVAGTLVLTGCGCSNNSKQNNATSANTSANATNNATQNATNNDANAQASMVGDYKLVEKTDDGVTFNEQQLNANGKGETLKVNADGTAVKTEQDGDTDSLTYDNANFKEKDGELKPYTFQNNTIKFTEHDGDTKVFQKI